MVIIIYSGRPSLRLDNIKIIFSTCLNLRYCKTSNKKTFNLSKLQYLLQNKLNTDVQRAKKLASDSPGLVDFAIGLVNSVLNLPDGQVKIFE